MGTTSDGISPNGMEGPEIHHLGVHALGVCGEDPCNTQYLGIWDTTVYVYLGAHHG